MSGLRPSSSLAGWLGRWPGWMALRGDGGVEKQTNGPTEKKSLFYRTSSPIGSTAKKTKKIFLKNKGKAGQGNP